MSINFTTKENTSILIIDDDNDLREVFEEILKRDGYKNVKGAATGEEAINILSTEFVQVVLIDLNLPDISGMDIISQHRAISPDTDYIIITGYGTVDSAIKAMQFEVFSYLEKPVSSEKLLLALEEVIEKNKLKMQNRKFLIDLEAANKEITFLTDLLINNVDDMNQSLLLTMVQIEKLNPTDEQKKVLRLFQQAIRKNARLTRNIKKMESIRLKNKADLIEVDLSRILTTVTNRLRSDYSDKNFEIYYELSPSTKVIADNDLVHLLFELFLISILNDPSPTIRIKLDFEVTEIEGKKYLKLIVNSFFVKCVFEQKDIEHPSDLKAVVSEQSFQDLGPFIINALVRFYDGIITSQEDSNNYLEIFLPRN